MSRTPIDQIDCGIAQTLSGVGESWTLLILRNAFHGMRTFDVFQTHLGISSSVLAARLSKLTGIGVFERRVSKADGRSVEYRLTKRGMDLYPIIVALMDWGEKWAPNPRGPRIRLVETATGRLVRPVAVLSEDGRELKAREVCPQPGAGASRSVRALLQARRGPAAPDS